MGGSTVLAINSAYVRARTAFREVGVNWPVVIWITSVHLLALAAPFFFSWPALISCVALAIVTGSFGVCMGYHRLLTHKSFQTYRPIRWLLALLGGLSGEGSALTWVAQHRKHHAFSDHEGDPAFARRDGRWWSHMFWFMPNFGRRWQKELFERYAPDMLKDTMMVVLHYLFSAVALDVCGRAVSHRVLRARELGPGIELGRLVDDSVGPGRADGLRAARRPG